MEFHKTNIIYFNHLLKNHYFSASTSIKLYESPFWAMISVQAKRDVFNISKYRPLLHLRAESRASLDTNNMYRLIQLHVIRIRQVMDCNNYT